MAKTLFEALTGYPESATPDAGVPDLLGGGAPEEEPFELLSAGGSSSSGREEPREDEFDPILAELERRADTDPEFARKLADAFNVEPNPVFLREKLRESRALVQQARAAGLLGASDLSFVEPQLEQPELLGIPSSFSDDYVAAHVVERFWRDLPRIDLEPTLKRFEDDDLVGILGWLVFNGPGAITVPRSLHPPFAEQFGRIAGAQAFIRHSAADDFVRRLNPRPGSGRIHIALFADFGTGLAHSRFIARQIALTEPTFDAAVHLGDVYYTGTTKQYQEYFEEPLHGVLENDTQLYVLPDNHDGYSGFHAFADFRSRHLPQQPGSYFAIETEHVQLIGVDTIWHSDRGRIQDDGVRTWLRERFDAGRAAKRANILLTGHEPYEYCKTKLNKLNDDLLELSAGKLDLWFWGNTHYCALFDRGPDTPYYGSCIGHGGYPYGTQPPRESAPLSAAPVIFAESGSRYEGSDVRRDRGMNGFCALEIGPAGRVELHYRDWRGSERFTATFVKNTDGSLAPFAFNP